MSESVEVSVDGLTELGSQQLRMTDQAELATRSASGAMSRLRNIMTSGQNAQWCSELNKSIPGEKLIEACKSLESGSGNFADNLNQAANVLGQADSDSASLLNQKTEIDAEFAAAGQSGSALQRKYDAEINSDLAKLSQYTSGAQPGSSNSGSTGA